MANYRRIYERQYNLKIPKGMHIHHIDGNKDNNDPSNLQMVTPEEHAEIHLRQGDPWYHRGCSSWISGASEAAKMRKNTAHTEKTKQRLSNTWEIIRPDGTREIIKNLWKYCRENNLMPNNMRQVALGNRSHHRNYVCKLISKGLNSHVYPSLTTQSSPKSTTK